MSTNLQAQSALISRELKTTSLIVAEKFGKRHDNVLRDIKSLKNQEKFYSLNFEEIDVSRPSQLNGAPIKSTAIEMTRDGFALLVMGFTGKKAMEWKIKFLEAFNQMEAQLKEKPNVPERFRLPQPCGEKNGRAYLSKQNVLDILAMHKNGYRSIVIARHMKCSRTTVWHIIHGHRYSKVTGIYPRSTFKYRPVKQNDRPVALPVETQDKIVAPAEPAPTLFNETGEVPKKFPPFRTYGGDYYNPFDYKDGVYIGDVAHSLAQTCCFIGHTDTMISVSDFCVTLQQQFSHLPHAIQMEALLYHSPVAFIGSMNRGIRNRVPEISIWETRIRDSIYLQYGIKSVHQKIIRSVNKQVLAIFAHQFQGVEDEELVEDWGILPDHNIKPFVSANLVEAESNFCRAFFDLKHQIPKK